MYPCFSGPSGLKTGCYSFSNGTYNNLFPERDVLFTYLIKIRILTIQITKILRNTENSTC